MWQIIYGFGMMLFIGRWISYDYFMIGNWSLCLISLIFFTQSQLRGKGQIKVVGNHQGRRFFRFFHFIMLCLLRIVSFPWKCIWKPRVQPRVNFLIWIVALGKIMTADNLRRRNVILVSLCKVDGETIDHLFLHYNVATELWDTVLNHFGMIWVMWWTY